MLHITNGDCAVPALRAAGVTEEVLPWREVLHEGPVPGGLDRAALRERRARFLAAGDGLTVEEAIAHLEARDARLERALARGEPVLLWFEADLFDERGAAVLAGAERWEPPRERWLGGLRIPPGRSPWHWDDIQARVLVAH